jgi:hypothetical protein
MSDREWDLLEFVERFKNGEFDGQLGEALGSLSPEQMEDLKLSVDARREPQRIVPGDLKRRI